MPTSQPTVIRANTCISGGAVFWCVSHTIPTNTPTTRKTTTPIQTGRLSELTAVPTLLLFWASRVLSSIPRTAAVAVATPPANSAARMLGRDRNHGRGLGRRRLEILDVEADPSPQHHENRECEEGDDQEGVLHRGLLVHCEVAHDSARAFHPGRG